MVVIHKRHKEIAVGKFNAAYHNPPTILGAILHCTSLSVDVAGLPFW